MKEKLESRIFQLAAQIIHRELNDPRIDPRFVSVTKVELTNDYRYCKIYVSILGTPAQQRTAMRGLEHARGYIQRRIASRLALRHAPIISFEQDLTIQKSFEIEESLKKIKEEKENLENSDKINEDSPTDDNKTDE